MDDRRIEELEVRIAYQERTIAELSSLAFKQGTAIERLEAQVKAMTARLKDVGQEKLPVNERPPHY